MSEWISVDERLPETFVPVLVLVECDRCIAVATCNEEGEFVQDTTQAELYGAEPLGEIAEQPTHWRHLK